jgi:superfamily I DNA/RNA helicase
MRVLSDVKPTPEQLAIASINRPGIEVIRGAAGSGKTTTALLRLRSLIGVFVSRQQRRSDSRPVRVLVLTFNKTLRGYVEALASQQVAESEAVELTISTFAKWARDATGIRHIVSDEVREEKLKQFANGIDIEADFLIQEIDYLMGRFQNDALDNYLVTERTGRGTTPRVEKTLRSTILDVVVRPYSLWLEENGMWDWNSLAAEMARRNYAGEYDVVIVDEAQDFSANQLRAIKTHLAEPHSVTFVLDTIQRIYARGFTWSEAGFAVRPENVRKLSVNYRNTKQIAAFARSLLTGLVVDDDAAIPDFESCTREGDVPIVLVGKYSSQLTWVSNFINTIDLSDESLAFLSPKGWFRDIKTLLTRRGLKFVEITRQSEWPTGSESIALSTMHSAKGLEFDYVVMIGLNREITDEGGENNEDKAGQARRLLAMAVGRAKKAVVIGYRADQEPLAMQLAAPDTFKRIEL